MYHLSFPALKGSTAGLITLPSPMFQQSKMLLESSSSNSAASCSCAHISLWISHLPFYPFATKPQTTYHAVYAIAGYIRVHENLLKDTGFCERFAHNFTRYLGNICFFKLYGNAHCASEIRIWPWGTTRSSLFTADKAQLIFMSSSFSRDSTPLFGNHCFKANLQDGSTVRVPIPTFRSASIHWVVLTRSACPAGSWAFPNLVGRPQPSTFLSSVPIASTCCFVIVLHQPPAPVDMPEHSWEWIQHPQTTTQRERAFSGGVLIVPSGSSVFITQELNTNLVLSLKPQCTLKINK